MATYYDYAERQEDAYVDWSAIGKQLSDKLDAENKFREDKKAEIDKDSREYGNKLNNPVQGEYKPANDFILDFANTAQQTRLLQDKLLKSGQWTLKQYTIARQNTKDGTDNLFNLAKYYQDNFKPIMAAYNKGEIQAMNIANLASIEGFANFSKSKGVINPDDGMVSMAGVYVDPKTGLKKIDKNIVPTEVMLKSLTTLIPTFQKDEAVANWKKSLGTMVESMYKSATLSGAGTITQLTGAGAISRYPQYAKEITNFNKSLDNSINSMFSNPYNLSSVLTENTGKYNDKSYVFDREVAKADPTKILLKIDPTTHLSTLDDTAPHYEAQKKEAMDYMKADMLASVDSEVKITTTAQNQLQERSAANREYGDRKAQEKKDTKLFAEMLSDAVTGNADQVKAGVQYLQGLGVPIERTTKGFQIFDAKKGTTLEYEFGKKIPDDMVKSLLGAVNIKDYNEDDIVSFASQFNKGRKINLTDTVSGPTKEEKPYKSNIKVEIFKDASDVSAPTLQTELKKLSEGFTVEDISSWGDDKIKIIGPSGAIKEFEADNDETTAINVKSQIDSFINEEVRKEREKEAAKKKAEQGTTTTTSGGKVR